MSVTKNILDENFTLSVQELLNKGEEIIWEAEPINKRNFAFLEVGGGYDPIHTFYSPLGSVLGFGFLFGFYFYAKESWIGMVMTLIITLAILIIPEVIKSKRRNNTKYFLTDRRVFFKLWNWGKGQIEFLNYEDIGQINLETFNDNSGNIYFFTPKETRIKTYDFAKGQQRHCPTFEQIPNAEELANKILTLKKKRQNKTNFNMSKA